MRGVVPARTIGHRDPPHPLARQLASVRADELKGALLDLDDVTYMSPFG